jgi:hypothetical protein
LEDGIDVEFFLFWQRILLEINWIHENFWVVHGAPANEASMVGKGGKLIFFYISINGFLNVEVLAHARASWKL